MKMYDMRHGKVEPILVKDDAMGDTEVIPLRNVVKPLGCADLPKGDIQPMPLGKIPMPSKRKDISVGGLERPVTPKPKPTDSKKK